MSRRNKLEKFAELLTFPNVYQNYDPKRPCLRYLGGEIVERKGHWATRHFRNRQAITLELACGGGEYTLALGERFPDRNFIGIDIKGNRIWKGARKAIAADLSNVAFLRTRIEQVNLFFENGEIDEMWITFPDPFLKKSKANRRLTSAAFLERYRQILKIGAVIHLKTDASELFDFTLETLADQLDFHLELADPDIYKMEALPPELLVKTFYENMHLKEGRKIKYLRIRYLGPTSS